MKTTQGNVSSRNHTRQFAAPGLILAGLLAGITLTQAEDTVPWKSASVGQVTITESGMVITEAGVAAHLGRYSKESDLKTVTYTAANGDELFAMIVDFQDNFPVMQVSVEFVGGTGRFEGATGGYVGTIIIDPIPVCFDPLSFAFTSTATGTLSTVGANKK
jgi:prophage DNA circulation protein